MQQEVPQLRFTTTRLASGPRVHYAEQGDPDGEPIIFLPAYTDSWFSFSRVLPRLSVRYHAYAVDQRGHGDSDRPACCYTVEDFTADVVAFLDAVGVGRATLVGHSGSCLVARRVAVAHGERVARLAGRQPGGVGAAGGGASPAGPGAGAVRAGAAGGRRACSPAGAVLRAAGCREPQAAGPRLEEHAGGPVRVR